MDSVIYAIINIFDDKIYVGQAYEKHKRWKNHKIALNNGNHGNRYLQSAWNKHGKERFIFVVLEQVDDIALLTEREQYWMDALRAADREHGYNLSPAAGSCLGVKHTVETKEKLSKIRKGMKRSEDFGKRVSEWMTGRTVSAETKEKCRQSHLGHKQSDATKAKRSAKMKGNKFNEGRKQSPAEVEIRRKANLGKKRSPETIAKMVAAQRKRWGKT